MQAVAQQHGVDPNQLAQTARHFDANQDGILQQSELQASTTDGYTAVPQRLNQWQHQWLLQWQHQVGQPVGAPMEAPMGGMMPTSSGDAPGVLNSGH